MPTYKYVEKNNVRMPAGEKRPSPSETKIPNNALAADNLPNRLLSEAVSENEKTFGSRCNVPTSAVMARSISCESKRKPHNCSIEDNAPKYLDNKPRIWRAKPNIRGCYHVDPSSLFFCNYVPWTIGRVTNHTSPVNCSNHWLEKSSARAKNKKSALWSTFQVPWNYLASSESSF